MVAYGISINLVEVTWKGKIKAQFPNPNDYSAFMGDFSSCTGAVTFLMMIASRFIFRKFGWGVAAQITPIVLLITGETPVLCWAACCLRCSLHPSARPGSKICAHLGRCCCWPLMMLHADEHEMAEA